MLLGKTKKIQRNFVIYSQITCMLGASGGSCSGKSINRFASNWLFSSMLTGRLSHGLSKPRKESARGPRSYTIIILLVTGKNTKTDTKHSCMQYSQFLLQLTITFPLFFFISTSKANLIKETCNTRLKPSAR